MLALLEQVNGTDSRGDDVTNDVVRTWSSAGTIWKTAEMTVDASVHRSLAVEANNSTWDFLSRPPEQLSPEEIEEMTRRAYAAAYHWQRAEGTTPANAARADWLLSRVWVVRGEGAMALGHAQRCMATCESASLADFDLAYAHESLARAHACLGDFDSARHHRDVAANVPVVDPEDKRIVDSDLTSGPWFGLS